MKYTIKANSIKFNDNTINVKYTDGTQLTIAYKPDYFIGWMSPLSIPEYFKLGKSPDGFTVIWPNGYEAQLYEAHDIVTRTKSSTVTYGYNWTKHNIITGEELHDLLLQPPCEDYMQVADSNIISKLQQISDNSNLTIAA